MTRRPGRNRPPKILALHGFTGDAQDFAPLAAGVDADWDAVDLPGHGTRSGIEDPAAYEMDAVVDELAGRLGPGRKGTQTAVVLGYSMGGRAALSLAARHPTRVGGLVLIGATPGLADRDERAARRRVDLDRAERVEREGIEAFLAWWSTVPLIATQSRIPEPWRSATRVRRRRLTARGLALSLRGTGTGAMAPIWDALPRLAMPVLLITGAEDTKFDAIAREMAAVLPQACHVRVPGAGHCAHLERPSLAARAICAWLIDALP